MMQRLHHTITDGEGGIRLSIAFLDLERSGDVEHGEAGAASESNRPTDDRRPAEPAGDRRP